MNVEQRLVHALRTVDQVAASSDLWSRVLHSIEEDRAHRRRVVQSVLAGVAVVAVLVAAGYLAMTDGIFDRHVKLNVMEAIETVALVALVAVLGPAIRRFGRNYAADLLPATPGTATSLLRLLDVAYYLVFAGFIMLTSDLDFDKTRVFLDAQLQDAFARIGGLLLVMGLLHAVTIMVLPVVALVFNSTRVGRKLPRWLVVLMALAAVPVGLFVLNGFVGLIIAGSGG